VLSTNFLPFSAGDSTYSYTFLRSVVCRLSVVCHIRSPCFNRSTDLDAIWQVCLCVTWGPWPQGKGKFGGRTHPVKTRKCKLLLPIGRTETTSDSDFSQLSLDLLLIRAFLLSFGILHFYCLLIQLSAGGSVSYTIRVLTSRYDDDDDGDEEDDVFFVTSAHESSNRCSQPASLRPLL